MILYISRLYFLVGKILIWTVHIFRTYGIKCIPDSNATFHNRAMSMVGPVGVGQACVYVYTRHIRA